MAKKKFPPARLYRLVVETVNDGIDYGWIRAHKHTDNPTEETIKTAIYDAITNNLCETFDFDLG